MKKIYRAWICLILIILTISMSGCAVKRNSNELVVWSHLSDQETDVLREIADKWSKENGIKVKVHSDKGDNRAFIEAAKAGMGPDIEYGINHSKIEKLYSEGLLDKVPENILDENKYIKAAVDNVTFDNKAYALPVSISTYALYYNKDKISTPPQTFDELVTLGSKYGFEYDINNIFLSYSFLGANGAYVFKKENGKYIPSKTGLNNSSAYEGYKMLQDMVNKYKMMPADIDSITSRKDFEKGKSAMYLSGPWDIEEIDKSNINYSISAMPKINGKTAPTFVNVDTAFVTSMSSNKDKAWQLLSYLNDNAMVELYKISGKIPTIESKLSDPEVKKNVKLNVFIDQIVSGGESIPNITEIQALQDTREPLSKLTSGKISPQECGKAIEDIINKYIQDEKLKN